MTPKEYLAASARTDGDEQDYLQAQLRACQKIEPLHYSLGLVTEAAEVADLIKKHMMYGRDYDKEKLKEEMGDLLWYLAGLCRFADIPFDDLFEDNIEKLQKRFPDRFTPEAALARADEIEG